MSMLPPDELVIVGLSLRVAVVSVACSLPVAVAIAWVLARFSFPGKTLVDAAVHLPLVLPPVVVGYALLVLFGRHGPLGRVLGDWFGIVFAFRWTGAALAAARAARHRDRHDAVVRARARRVRSDDHLRVQHSGRNPDASARDLHLHAGSRSRNAGVAPQRARRCAGARRARRIGMDLADRAAPERR